MDFEYWLSLRGKIGKKCSGEYVIKLAAYPGSPESNAGNFDRVSYTRTKELYLIEEIQCVVRNLVEMYGARIVNIYNTEDIRSIGELEDQHRDSCAEARSADSSEVTFSFSLAHYWDRRFCQTAFDKTPEEIQSLLAGQVPMVELFGNGVFVAFSDHYATAQEQEDWNRKFRPILGGYGLFAPYPNARFPKPIKEPEPGMMPDVVPSKIGEFAVSYHEAFRRGDAPVGGFAHWEALEKLSWDGSEASLDALNSLLVSWKQAGWKVDLHDQATQNTLLLIAFHLGMQAANWSRSSIEWQDWDELIRRSPGYEKTFGYAFAHSIVCWLDGEVIFFPLIAVMKVLEGSEYSQGNLRLDVMNTAKRVKAPVGA